MKNKILSFLLISLLFSCSDNYKKNKTKVSALKIKNSDTIVKNNIERRKNSEIIKISYTFNGFIDYGDVMCIAKIGNKTYNIASNEICFPSSIAVKDFNNNGYTDVLFSNADACGGNALPTSTLYFCIYDKETDNFVVTEGFGSIMDMGTLNIFEENGVLCISFTSNTIFEKFDETYILREQEAIRIKYREYKEVETIIELKSDCEGKYILFDIDNDGIKDKISCGEYYGRWIFNFQEYIIELTKNNSTVKLSGYRIGIINSKTDGVFDLVTGFDNIHKWNGYDYSL